MLFLHASYMLTRYWQFAVQNAEALQSTFTTARQCGLDLRLHASMSSEDEFAEGTAAAELSDDRSDENHFLSFHGNRKSTWCSVVCMVVVTLTVNPQISGEHTQRH